MRHPKERNSSTLTEDQTILTYLWGLAMCTVRNLQISEPSSGILKKFQHSLTLHNIKYNCVVLFV